MIRVSFCCNDDHGRFAEYVNAIDFTTSDGHDMTITGPDKTMRLVMYGVKIGRRKYETSGVWTSGAGNVFWDATGMPLDAARLLVSDLLCAGWQVEQYTHGGPFADLLVVRQEGE